MTAAHAEYVARCQLRAGGPNVSDIYLLLPMLAGHATGRRVVELGTRTGNSAIAFLSAPCVSLVSVDPHRHPPTDELLKKFATADNIDLRLVSSSSLELDPGAYLPFDMIFIDTWHTYKQLRAELFRWGPHTGQLIAMHDTYTYRDRSEDGSTPGLKQAIDDFLFHHDPWRLILEDPRCNGLTLLQKV